MEMMDVCSVNHHNTLSGHTNVCHGRVLIMHFPIAKIAKNVIKSHSVQLDGASIVLAAVTMKGSAALLVSILVLVSVLAQQSVLAEPACRPTGKYLTSNPRDCRSYYYCFEGKSYYGICEQGYRFDESRQSCLPSTVSECFPCPASGTINMPHPTSCQKFVLCFLGVANERECPSGLLFNQQLRQCDLSANVVC